MSTSPASAAAAPPAATANAPATPSQDSKPAADVVIEGTREVLEKHFLAEGYKIEMHNGEKVFCRREEQLGSRLGGHKNCGTAEQLIFIEQEAKAAYQRGQMQQNNPKGN